VSEHESPDVIRRYFVAADAGDLEALAACFTPDGAVVDEDQTFVGHDEIIRWRRELAGKFTYTSELTGTESGAGNVHRAFVHIEGNFPGGQADLTFRFALDRDLISALTIGG
jgi:ketosteroid isomerase-like protein